MTDSNTQEPSRDRMPVLFVGHGSPMNAIEDNRWSRGFSALRDEVPRPVAILAISAHWYVAGSYLTGNSQPETIHDFSGFPPELYEINYPAAGNVDLAELIRTRINKTHTAHRVSLSTDWGLDHGVWSVLRWIYPQADVPVIQLSINRELNAQQHYELARELAELRKHGVLILASGNIVHNLRDAFQQKQTGTSETPDWAKRFDETVEQAITQHDTDKLINLHNTADGQLAHPSVEHWLPLIYAYAAADKDDRVRFPMEGFDWGSISMRSIIFG